MSKAPAIKHFRPFLVATPETFPICRDFYVRIGFELLWEKDDAAEFRTGPDDGRFLLTLHHGLVPTRVAVFHLEVDDVDVWHRHIESLNLQDDFPTTRFSTPEITAWGWHLFYVWDPAGALLHIGHPERTGG